MEPSFKLLEGENLQYHSPFAKLVAFFCVVLQGESLVGLAGMAAVIFAVFWTGETWFQWLEKLDVNKMVGKLYPSHENLVLSNKLIKVELPP